MKNIKQLPQSLLRLKKTGKFFKEEEKRRTHMCKEVIDIESRLPGTSYNRASFPILQLVNGVDYGQKRQTLLKQQAKQL